MKKLLDLGFKKITTDDGFVMFELSPARLHASKLPDPSHKQQATSDKPQATSCDNLSHLHRKKTR
jgi:hypothetical protein